MLSAESLPTLQGAENVSLIAVMGVTGSGKSTFIKHVTGSDKVIVGSDLTSCRISSYSRLCLSANGCRYQKAGAASIQPRRYDRHPHRHPWFR